MDYINIDNLISLACVVGGLIGLLGFRYQNKFLRMLFYQLLVNCTFMLISFLYLEYLRSINNLNENRMWMMNIQLLVEMELIFFSLFWVLKTKRHKIIINAANLIFLGVFALQAVSEGIRGYLNWADLTACIGFTILLYLVFFELSKTKSKSWWKSPEIIAVFGLFIYFACSVPFISMHNYLLKNYPETAWLIYYNIAMSLSLIRYFLFAVALYLVIELLEKN